MEAIHNIDEATEKVLTDMNEFITIMREQSHEDISGLSEGISRLRQIRSSLYENLNQIQHEYLILQGLKWLVENNIAPYDADWSWNPRQTGVSSEPDLRAVVDGAVIVSAEATTSEEPKGSIDTHMKKTLTSLSAMEGSKYYFIRTDSMQQRADAKIKNNDWIISVVKIEA